MNQFIESFFDTNLLNFKLWSKNVTDYTIKEDEVLFKGSMLKINRKNNKTKERYFVLTKKNLFYLKSEKSKKIRGVMDTEWVRIEYINEESEKG